MTAAGDDVAFMRRAVRLARRGLGRTRPNPVVGCVVVRNGSVVAEGWHRRAGGPHAEAEALGRLGGRAEGATLYATLEPCGHFGRTPPCTEAILAAGIRRVVYGNPDPLTGGAARLREADVEVVAGVGAAAAARANEAWLVAAPRRRPFVALKLAVSLDGRLATRTGHSRWVTGEPARRAVARLRDRHDAVLVGTGTLRADDPRLTARVRGARDPVRVVLDARLGCPPDARVLGPGGETWLVAAADTASAAPPGARVLRVPGDAAGRLELTATLEALWRAEIVSVLVEGGAALAGALLAAGLVDRVYAFVAPVLIGADGLPAARLAGAETMADAWRLTDVTSRRYGEDVLITGRLPCSPDS